MSKRSKPFTATADQVLMLDDILLQLADRSRHPDKYGLDADQLLQNDQALEHLNELMARIGKVTSH
jgi:hypothetical protein